MSAIITNELRMYNKETFTKRLLEYPSYVFIGKDTPWKDDQIPDIPNGSQQEYTEVMKEITGLKRINETNIISVIMRINWSTNTVYDEYRQDINMLTARRSDGRRLQFYVVTDEFNIYKCISNNSNSPSTIKPTSNQALPFRTSDGYIWKYMYTLKSSDVFNYMTDAWCPVYTLEEDNGSAQWQSQLSAVDGSLSKINIVSKGVSYSTLVPPTINITGDGTGASASVTIDPLNGSIQEVNITNYGQGYTYAQAEVVSTTGGLGGILDVVLAPKGGHGKDPIRELGGNNLMIFTEISGATDNDIPLTSFRRAGIVSDMVSKEKGTRIKVDDVSEIHLGNTVVGNNSNATGTVVLISYDGQYIFLDNVIGTFMQNEPITVEEEYVLSTTDIDNNTDLPLSKQTAGADSIQPNQGKLLYLSNRERISRSETQTEEIRLVVTF